MSGGTAKMGAQSLRERTCASTAERDTSLNCFGVDASQPLAEWRRKGWIHVDDPRGWFQQVLPLLIGPAHGGRRAPDRALEGDPPPMCGGSRRTASRAMCCAARASARRCRIGPMTAGGSLTGSANATRRASRREAVRASESRRRSADRTWSPADAAVGCRVPGASGLSDADDCRREPTFRDAALRIGGVAASLAGRSCHLASAPMAQAAAVAEMLAGGSARAEFAYLGGCGFARLGPRAASIEPRPRPARHRRVKPMHPHASIGDVSGATRTSCGGLRAWRAPARSSTASPRARRGMAIPVRRRCG